MTFQVLAWMTTTSKMKNRNQWENCQKFAHKLSENACTWHEVVDQTFHGLSTNLQEQSQKWTQACDRRLAGLISQGNEWNPVFLKITKITLQAKDILRLPITTTLMDICHPENAEL